MTKNNEVTTAPMTFAEMRAEIADMFKAYRAATGKMIGVEMAQGPAFRVQVIGKTGRRMSYDYPTGWQSYGECFAWIRAHVAATLAAAA